MSFLERLKDATIGASGYVRLARDRASGFGYIALLLLIVLLIRTGIDTVNFKNAMGFAAAQLAAGPDFALRNGEVEYSGAMPYRVEEGGNIIVVDTTGQTGPEVLNGAAQGILITKTQVYQVKAGGAPQVIDLKQVPFTFTKQDIVGVLTGLWWIVPVGYAFVYLFQLGFKALDACILGLIALMIASGKGRKVTFDLGFKLGLYAMTLPIIIQWIIPGYSTIPFSRGGLGGFFAWWAIAIGYLMMGLQHYFKAEDEEASGNPFGPVE